MKCEICGKHEATVHLTLIAEKQTLQKVDLCEICAKTHGVNDPTGFALAAILQQLGKQNRSHLE
jgi:protein arginine kinase activator